MNKTRIDQIITPSNNASFEELCAYVGRIASVCVGGKYISDLEAIKVGIKCLSDAALKTPSTPWQYVPIEETSPISTFWNNARGSLKEYHYISENNLFEFITESLNFDDFFAFGCRSIGMVFDHMVKHNDLSVIKESLRHLPEDHEFQYEFPDFESTEEHCFTDFDLYFFADGDVITPESLALNASKIDPDSFTRILRKVYKRVEMWNRHHSSFILVDYKICGTKEQFENLFNERSRNTCIPNPDCKSCKRVHRPCAQLETRNFVQLIENIVDGND